MKPSKTTMKPLIIAFFTIFLDLLGFGIMIPIQPFYVQEFGASPTQITILGASYSLMQFLFAPFWGKLSDRIGRRPIILVSVAVSALGHLIFGLGNSLIMIFAARMLAGFGNANLGTAQAIISDVTTPENRAKGMGLIGAAFGLGFIIGPAVGGVLGQYSMTLPAFFASGLAVCNFLFAWLFLPETLASKTPGDNGHRRNFFSITALKKAARHPDIAILFSMTFIYTLGFAIMEQVIGLFIEKIWVLDTISEVRSKEAARLTAVYLVVVGFTAVIIQGGLIGRLSKRFGERRLARFGLVTLTIALGAIPIAGSSSSFAFMLLTAMLLAVGSGTFNPSNSALVSRAADPGEQGSILGLNQSLSSLGRVLGPACAGLIFEFHVDMPFYIAAALTALAAIQATRLRNVT